MVFPVFYRGQTTPQKLKIMLSFDVHNNENVSNWCRNLSSILEKNNIKATIFFSGKIVEKNPKILNYFKEGVDIGSQTYNYIDLTSVSDFTIQLAEVKKGKQVIDSIGNLDTKIFKAPYRATDENIYYLLNQCNITADFSYLTQFNLFEKDQFIKYEATTHTDNIDAFKFTSNTSENLGLHIIPFDTSNSIQEINQVILGLKQVNVEFVNASDLAGLDLTGRGD
jgi:hypothetical protein